MKLSFSKDYLENYRYQGQYMQYCIRYRVSDEGKQLGEFVSFYKASIFNIGKTNYRIMPKQKFWGNDYLLIDETERHVIGHFKHPRLPWNNRTLLLGRTRFECTRQENGMKEWFTRGLYKILISNGTDAAEYTFKMNTPMVSFKDETTRPFSGEIEVWGDNYMLPVFAGLHFVEDIIREYNTSP